MKPHPRSESPSTPPAEPEAPVVRRDWKIPEAAPGGEAYNDELSERLAEALNTREEGYQPRTEHLNEDGSPRFTNRLILESSPYLNQHAHNPVDWHPWGEDAFEKARRLGKAVFLSVGYSTCHWCHVMERESFEDIEIATFINSNFVPIKVDREERPDVDNVYMEAVRLLTRRGGWPMTVVMTPGRQPFFGGTYFPARDGDRGRGRGLLTILTELANEYANDRDSVVARAAELTARLQAVNQSRAPGSIPRAAAVFAPSVGALGTAFDRTWGGFGRAPKFPRPVLLDLLMRYHRRTGEPHARDMFETTLEKMAAGGIYDHVGGGFHRYSTDTRWLVPHFEKMLYDNAQLVMAYLDGYQITGRADFARVARETLDYVAREMTSPEGGFYSATDADSPSPHGHEEEGLYFTWTPAELREVLDLERARMVESYYGVTELGNFEGRSIFRSWMPVEQVASDFGVSSDEFMEELDLARGVLYERRQQRQPPGKDTKVLAAWNGLMVSAFARAALVLGEPRYAEIAARAGDFLLMNMVRDGRLLRSYKDRKARHAGVADDYAFVAAGLLDLFEATSSARWMRAAIDLHSKFEEHFWDTANGGYFYTADDAEELLTREKPDYDGAKPSANSVAVSNLLRLYHATTEEHYRTMAEETLAAFAHVLDDRALAVPKLVAGYDAYLDINKEIILIKPDAAADVGPFIEELARAYIPNKLVIIAVEGEEADELSELVPLVARKTARDGKVTAYVCEERVCKLPTGDPAVFAKQIATVAPYPGF